MKVLVIGAPNHTVISGGEKYIREVIDIGEKIGFVFEEVYLYKSLINQSNLKCRSRLINGGFGYIAKHNFLFKVIDYKLKMLKLNWFLKNNKYDLIIINTSIVSLNKKYLDKCVFIQHEDNQLYEKFAKRPYYRFFNLCTISLKAKYVVCYTEKSRDMFKKIDVRKNRVYFTANLYVDKISDFLPQPERLVYLGRICKEKGVDKLVEIAKFLDEPIHIYGGGPYEIKEIENIVMHGVIEPKDVKTVFETAKLNILLSKSEGLGFSIIEGFSYGVPCLLVNSSTNSEYLVDNGNNGILCEKNGTIEAIANVIKNFDSSHFSPAKIKLFCTENFSHEKFIENWETIFMCFVK